MNTRNRVVAAGILIVAFAIPRLAHPQGLDQDLKTGQRESEQANESIYIPFGWKVGDRKQFAVSRTEYRNGIAESSPKQTIFDIEIVSEADEQLVAR